MLYLWSRLRWSRGSVLKPGRSRRIFRAKKSSARLYFPSEGSLNLRRSRNLGKITTGHLSLPQFHLSLQRHVVAKGGTSKGGEKQWQTIPKNVPHRFHNRALVPAGPASRAEYEWMNEWMNEYLCIASSSVIFRLITCNAPSWWWPYEWSKRLQRIRWVRL